MIFSAVLRTHIIVFMLFMEHVFSFIMHERCTCIHRTMNTNTNANANTNTNTIRGQYLHALVSESDQRRRLAPIGHRTTTRTVMYERSDRNRDGSGERINSDSDETTKTKTKTTEYHIDDEPRYRSSLNFLKKKSKRDNLGGANADANANANETADNRRETKRRNQTNESDEIDEMLHSYTSTTNAENTSARVNVFPPLMDEEYSIDSFLNGEYDRPFSEDAGAPHPGLSPKEIVETALHALRYLDIPEEAHGAAVFSRFLSPLTRSERWGGSVSGTLCPWKEILRGSLTPTLLARRIRASQDFSVLLDWQNLDVTEGLAVPGMESTFAFVNAALHFQSDGIEPFMMQFKLRQISGVWLIDTAAISKREWFVADGGGDDEQIIEKK